MFSAALLVRWGWESQFGELCFSALASVRGTAGNCQIFQAGFLVWRGQYLCLLLPKLIPMPEWCRGTLHLLCSWASNSAHSSPSRLSGVSYNPSVHFLGVGKLGPNTGKIPHLRIWTRQTCTPSSLIKVCPDIVLQMSKVAGWDYYFGAAGKEPIRQLY